MEKETAGRTARKMRRPNKMGEETINTILETAKAMLTEDGAAGFTMDRLSRKCGITRGTLLYHFPKKENLLYRLMQDYVSHLEGRLREGMEIARDSLRYPKTADPWASGFIEWYRKFREEKKGYTAFGLAILAISTEEADMQKLINSWYADLFSRLRESANPDALPIVLMLEGLFFLNHFGIDVLTDEEIESLLNRCAQKISRN